LRITWRHHAVITVRKYVIVTASARKSQLVTLAASFYDHLYAAMPLPSNWVLW